METIRNVGIIVGYTLGTYRDHGKTIKTTI